LLVDVSLNNHNNEGLCDARLPQRASVTLVAEIAGAPPLPSHYSSRGGAPDFQAYLLQLNIRDFISALILINSYFIKIAK